MAIACVAGFVDTLVRGAILEEGQQGELAALGARHPEPRTLARELIRRGWLTAYQVNQLFLDRAADLVLGPYVLLERLGEGAMGQVFKARHRSLGRVVAVKVVRKNHLDNPNALPRFHREIQAVAQLDHPNVVRGLDAAQAGGTCFFVMEYIEGTDLFRLVKERGPLPVAQALDYVRQAALGLQHAFERGLVHRDIKPANLLVARAAAPRGGPSSALLARPRGTAPRWGVIKILDLGLARVLGEEGEGNTLLTQVGSVMGTPDFIAPEQARNSHASDIRADLYSLGCTLYFLLTGQVPFPNGSLTEKLMQHQFDEPEPPGPVRRERLLQSTPGHADLTKGRARLTVPDEVAALVRRLMAKRPQDRYQTPAELAEALLALANRLEVARPARPKLRPTENTLADGAVVARVPLSPAPLPADSQTQVVITPAPHRPRAPRTQRMHSPDRGRRRWLGAHTRGFLVFGGLFLALILCGRTFPRSVAENMPAPAAAASAAEVAWARLLQDGRQPPGNPEDLRGRLVAFRAAFPGTPRGRDAAALLARLPSPLDGLMPAALLRPKRDFWFPADLVAVLGEHRPWPVAPAQCVAVSPDGGELARAGTDNRVRRWQAPSLRELSPLSGHRGRIDRLAYSPDGGTLASASQDGVVALWDAHTGKACHLWEAHKYPVSGLTFTPDGKTLVSGSWDGTVKLWDATTGRYLRTLPGRGDNRVLALAVSPDGRLLACGHEDHTLRLWDLTASRGQPRAVYRGNTSWVKVVAFAPDGRTLVSGGGGDGPLRVCTWDGASFRSGAVLEGHRNVVHGIAFAPDGKTLASASEDGSVKVWDVAAGQLVREWADLRGPVNAVAFAPDGRHLATASANGTAYVLRLAKAP